MIDKLLEIKTRFEEVGRLMLEPDAMQDMKEYARLSKEYKELERIVVKYEEYALVLGNIESAKNVLREEKDPDFREMAKAELDELDPKKQSLEDDLKTLLIPKDPNDDKNAILELRAGTGGDEAGIFAGDLFRMYQRFAERMNWHFELLSYSEGSSGGYKEVVCMMSGYGAYGKLKYESGVHRVQRVPLTESQGRVHTSAATVAVLPEVEDVAIDIDLKDIQKDVFRASGAGGQHVNKTESAVRITHTPTGLVVECQDERSQIKNYERALKVLKSRLYDLEMQKQTAAVSAARKTMVKTGDRSEKIRTYNYPQSRVTDHRINMSVHNLPTVMDGDLLEFIEQLSIAENAERLKDGV
ncbi:MAG: peptide chain release factor 1 [Cytophagales bacterium]|nr:MAG: peptide chain release factor 1 [Cytophagales bacterium]TAF61199.1 MAG: peptide chain release factor 1 [Cytophagales bacterium]